MKILLIALLSFTSTLLAQNGQKEKPPERTLRILISGTRPLPHFKKEGNEYIEVDPPNKLIPPTAFEIVGKKKAASVGPAEDLDKKETNEYSAWINEMVTIPKYKGEATLKVILKRPLIKRSNTDIEVSCPLAQLINPLVIIHPGKGTSGWDKPLVTVIDTDPTKLPEKSIVAFNFSKFPIRLLVKGGAEVIKPGEKKLLKVTELTDNAFKYKMDAVVGKKVVTVTNTAHTLRAKTRLYFIASDAPGAVKDNPVNLRIIKDLVPEVPKDH